MKSVSMSRCWFRSGHSFHPIAEVLHLEARNKTDLVFDGDVSAVSASSAGSNSILAAVKSHEVCHLLLGEYGQLFSDSTSNGIVNAEVDDTRRS